MRCSWRAFTLIEVLVAFALLTLCMVPLLYPHFSILKEETRVVQELELDRLSTLAYGTLLQDLYRGEWSFTAIQQGEWRALNRPFLQGRPFVAAGRVRVLKAKPVDEPKQLLLECELVFMPKKREGMWSSESLEERIQGAKWRYRHVLYAERSGGGDTQVLGEDDEASEK